ncbi:MAG: hypothetical protein V1777_04755 [Candidatus Micrarchaeota archaeon]
MPTDSFFRDFTLLELSHILGGSLDGGLEDVIAVQRRIDEAKRAIDEQIKSGNVKKGDLVMLEGPKQYTFKHFKEEYGFAARDFQEEWKPLLKMCYNFYHILAQHAKKKGLRVEFLERGTTQPGGRLSTATRQIELGLYQLPRDKAKRLEYLVTVRRDDTMVRLIQSRKPRLVIAAAGHAAWIEKTLRPTRVVFTSRKYQDPAERAAIVRYAQRERMYRQEYMDYHNRAMRPRRPLRPRAI